MRKLSVSLLKVVTLASFFGPLAVNAAVVSNVVNQDFSANSVSFGYGPTFTFSNNGSGFPSPVSIQSDVDAAVTSLSLFGPTLPTSYFDPARGGGLVFDNSFYQYTTFSTPTTIDYSFAPTYIGLRVSLQDGYHYGYAQFEGTFLKSYGFESEAGIGIEAGALTISAVPEPETFAMLLTGLGIVSFVARRRRGLSV